jgi:hypothetical protein
VVPDDPAHFVATCSRSVTLMLLLRRCEYAADYDTATPHVLDFSKVPSPARQVRCSYFCAAQCGVCSLGQCALLLRGTAGECCRAGQWKVLCTACNEQ